MTDFSSSKDASIATLIASIISFSTCFPILLSIRFNQNDVKSHYLQLVVRLLFSDIGLSIFDIVYYFAQLNLNDRNLEYFCKFHFPAIMFFFLSSFGWTIMLALRFRNSLYNGSTTDFSRAIPFWFIWSISFILIIPSFLSSLLSKQSVIILVTNLNNTDKVCSFDHNSFIGIFIDIVTFQLPLVFTIIINIYSYSKGLRAIRNTPHSVIARQMKKAGGYLAILLIVWLPNALYNFFVIFNTTNHSFTPLLDLAVCLTSLQVFIVFMYLLFIITPSFVSIYVFKH
jgi:hypothetical protein